MEAFRLRRYVRGNMKKQPLRRDIHFGRKKWRRIIVTTRWTRQ